MKCPFMKSKTTGKMYSGDEVCKEYFEDCIGSNCMAFASYKAVHTPGYVEDPLDDQPDDIQYCALCHTFINGGSAV